MTAPISTPPKRYNRQQASEYLKTQHGVDAAPTTLAKLACIGGGPRYRKNGRAVLYEEPDLDAYVEERLTPPAATAAEHRASA